MQTDLDKLGLDDAALVKSFLLAEQACVKILDSEGRLVYMNENGRCLMEVDDFDVLLGRPWASLWPDASHKDLLQAIEDASKGGLGHFSGQCPTYRGTQKWWDVRVVAVPEGPAAHYLSISREIEPCRPGA